MMVSGDHQLRDGIFSVADELSGHRRLRWLLFFVVSVSGKIVCGRTVC